MKKKTRSLQIAMWQFYFKTGPKCTCLAAGCARDVRRQLDITCDGNEIFELERMHAISRKDINSKFPVIMFIDQ